MDRREESRVRSKHFNDLKNFIFLISKLTSKEKVAYFKSLKHSQIKLIHEITVNLLNENVPIPYSALLLLKNIKQTIRLLASNKISDTRKRAILTSISGLHYITVITPYLIKLFTSK